MGAVLLVLLWEIVSLSGVVNSFLFPNPFAVLTRGVELFFSNEMVIDLVSTLLKIVIAIVFGGIIGFVMGIILAHSTKIYDAFSPLLDFFRSIPATALFPLCIIILGAGDSTSLALAAWICAIYLALHVAKGLRSTTQGYLLVARSLHKTQFEIFFQVRLMEALPTIFVGLRAASSLAIVVIIVTEMFVGTTHGLGKVLIDAAYSYDMAKLYAVVLLIGLIGYFLNKLIIFLEKRIVHWESK
jgi:NitT/TauT family transport system permease protein